MANNGMTDQQRADLDPNSDEYMKRYATSTSIDQYLVLYLPFLV